MSRIILGKSANKNVELDLDLLLRTRLLIQANSGGGKSWLLRRLAEQLFGKIPVIIIDPEGEFATLREKFGYVLVGKGGETPADPRSAALLAHKLLDLRASAVCDLYELKPSDRHHWVRLFLEAMIDAPKKLWRPTIVVVDEAHTFCPEKGAGESEASDAMTSLPTRGRKRRFCAVWATQRLGKLRKDASAELLNRMIGPTFEDVDLKRAADLLSIRSEDRRDFDQQMRVLDPGHFFALGRALSKERVLVAVGAVETSHEIEESKYGIEAPPPPEKVRALLPKLADLPKAAEEQAKTVAELRADIRSLKAQLRAQPPPSPDRSGDYIHKQLAQRAALAEIERATQRAVKQAEARFSHALAERDAFIKKLKASAHALIQQATNLAALSNAAPATVPKPEPAKQIPLHVVAKEPVRPVPIPRLEERPVKHSTDDGTTRAQQRILRALAEFEAIGRTEVSRTWIAARAGASHRSSAYTNNLGALRSRGLIDYGANSSVRLTTVGRANAPAMDAPLTSEQMFESCLRLLGPAQQRILQTLHHEYPASLGREELATRAEASSTSSAFTNNLGALRSAGMIEYGPNSTVKCSDWLFID